MHSSAYSIEDLAVTMIAELVCVIPFKRRADRRLCPAAAGGLQHGPARRRSSSVRLLAEWRALIANMTVPELRVPPALTSAHHHIHLDRRAQRQGGHADRGAGRVGLGEVPAV